MVIPRLFIVVAIISVTMLLLCSPSCDQTGSTIQATSDEKLQEAEDAAQEARSEALAATAPSLAPEDFLEAERALAKAAQQSESGQRRGAVRSYRAARSGFSAAQRRATQVAKAMAASEQQLVEVKRLREIINPDELWGNEAKRLWGDAQECLERGQQYIADGKLRAGQRQLSFAVDSLQSLQEILPLLKRERERALVDRSLLAELKKRAEGLGDSVAQELELARTEELEGERYFTDGEFARARRSFQSARIYYADAIHADAVQLAQNHKPKVQAPSQPEKSPPPEPEIATDEIKPARQDPVRFSVKELLASFHGEAQYEDGMLRLSYPTGSGPELRKDIQVLRGGRYLQYQGRGNIGIEEYTFAGNTRGCVLLNAPFADQVRIRFQVLVQMVLGINPVFEVILNSNGGSSYYASNFGSDIRVYRDGLLQRRVPSIKPEQRKHPTRWVGRLQPITIEVVYSKSSEEEMGVLRVFHEGEEVSRLRTDRFRGGQVGFLWNDVKFVVKDLEIEGRPDLEWLQEHFAEPEDRMVPGSLMARW